jgi:hypothetical protein
MDLMHSGNLIILYTMSRCIPTYGVHCLSINTPQRDLRKRGDWIWGDLVAHSNYTCSSAKKAGRCYLLLAKETTKDAFFVVYAWIMSFGQGIDC